MADAEVELLLTAVRWVKHRAAILVAYGASLRSAEMCRLQISDIVTDVGLEGPRIESDAVESGGLAAESIS